MEELEILQSSEGKGGHAPVLYGIGFQFEDGYFAICNGLDQNEIVTNIDELSVNRTVIRENPAKRSS
ncbi:hypothetical protein [Mesobacillus foraminis]|uniref:hypothetical protein n=1 Tax=Mesobacillus foraminis TaxID=279826 RepID=UPI0013CE428A|nr:hypothetical protein [Mesobacillus foraminis]